MTCFWTGLVNTTQVCDTEFVINIATAIADGKVFEDLTHFTSSRLYAGYINPSDSNLYLVGNNVVPFVYNPVCSYSLSGSVSSASYINQVVTSTNVTDIKFSSDGLLLFVSDSTSIHKYTLSVAWNVGTAVFTSSKLEAVRGFTFSADGMKLFAAYHSSYEIKEYNLISAYNISSLSLVNTIKDRKSVV